jgi:demethylmenaquinone methyltransferase/2-methoxy-6-polyprenyl-1,4-benzoquinol methylase
MLGVARRKRRRPNLRFVQGDATALPFGDGEFDASCVSFALHEMPASIREAVLAEMVRVTAPGGTIVVVDYGLPKNALASFMVRHAVGLYERDHYAEFIRTDVRAFLEKAGVSVREERRGLSGIARVLVGTSDGTRTGLSAQIAGTR